MSRLGQGLGVDFCMSSAVCSASVANVSRKSTDYDLRSRENVSFGTEVIRPHVLYLAISLTLAEIWAHNLRIQTAISRRLCRARWGAVLCTGRRRGGRVVNDGRSARSWGGQRCTTSQTRSITMRCTVWKRRSKVYSYLVTLTILRDRQECD